MAWGLLASVALAGGCAKQPPQQPAARDAPPDSRGQIAQHPAAQPVHVPPVPPENFDPAAAVARRAQQYSREMGPLIDQRTAGANVPTTTPHQQPPSDVTWDDASTDIRRAHEPGQRQPEQPRSDVKPPADANPLPVHPGDAEEMASANSSASAQRASDRQPRAEDSPPTTRPSDSTAAPLAVEPPGDASDAPGLNHKLQRRVRDYPRDVSGHLDYQLLRFLLDEPVPNLPSIAPLPGEDRELVAAVIDGLVNFRNTLRSDNNMLLSRKVRPLLEMADRLRSQAELSIPTVALCTSVRTFGDYDPIDPARFAAGRAHEVILYCEVQNFASQLDDKQTWQTRLTKDAVLYTESGMSVWSDKTETVTDSARQRRHDFFIVKKMKIPANLAVGRYLLKVSIVDQQASRVAEATMPLVIAAQGP
jgi:hypothetical protein